MPRIIQIVGALTAVALSSCANYSPPTRNPYASFNIEGRLPAISVSDLVAVIKAVQSQQPSEIYDFHIVGHNKVEVGVSSAGDRWEEVERVHGRWEVTAEGSVWPPYHST